ncbi:hypothetical protein COB87_002710 [Candidatus Wolfebacteria bacterium]|nr:hypothetical protein [Candidatus Wolfebacteria bacterium]
MIESEILKVFVPAIVAFLVGIGGAPVLTHFLYKHKAWKKVGGRGVGMGGGATPIFDSLHGEDETKVPRMGGILIWGSVAITLFGIFIFAQLAPNTIATELDFLSRSQTWIPAALFFLGAFVGLINDLIEVVQGKAGLKLPARLLIVGSAAALAAVWFYTKLEVTSIGIPFAEPLELGIWIIPFFILGTLVIYASGVIDGIDGLSGGVFSIIFGAYAALAFFQGQFDIAAFSATIAGATLAFLWFNVPPARFYMTETGTMALTLALATIAIMTDTLGDGIGIAVLPIIALPLIGTVITNVIQVFSKKVFKKKVFKVAPIHHHFEAIGWPSHKVTMRYWIITLMFAIIGVTIAIIA